MRPAKAEQRIVRRAQALDLIDTVYPPGRGHIIMDNLSAHDTPDVNDVVRRAPSKMQF